MVVNNSKSKTRATVLTVIVLLLYFVFLIGPESIRKSRVDYSTGAVPEITVDSPVTEEIYSYADGFESIELMYGTFGRVNYSNLTLTLTTMDGEVIKTWNVDCTSIMDKSFVTYKLDEPIKSSKEQSYMLTITSDAKAGNGVTLFTCGERVLYRVGHAQDKVVETLMTILSLLPFIIVPFVFWKMRDNNYGLAYAVYILLILMMHYYMPTNTKDDLFMIQANDGYTALTWAVWKWNTWSSRFLQEFFGFIVVNRPLLWKSIDATMFALFPYLINRSLNLTNYDRFFTLAALPLYPILDQISAGWMCTTMTYIWPVFFALLTTAILRDVMDGRRIKWFEYPIFFFSLIYASNHELMAIYLLGILGYCVVVSYKEYLSKRVFVWSATAVAVLNMIVILLCPGTSVRSEGEASINFANYGGYNAFDKLFLGINRCLDIFVSKMSATFLVLCVVTAILVFVKTKSNLKRIIALFPVMSWFAIHGLFQTALTGDLMWVHYLSFRGLGLLLYAFVLLGALVFSILIIFSGDSFVTRQGILVSLIFVMGMATTVAMGFSPTVYVSGPRTSTFTYYGIIVVIVALLSKGCKDNKLSQKDVMPISIVLFIALMGIRLMNVIGITII